MPYFVAEDTDAACEKAEGLGGEVMHGPLHIPTVGRITLPRDPQGAMFYLATFLPTRRQG